MNKAKQKKHLYILLKNELCSSPSKPFTVDIIIIIIIIIIIVAINIAILLFVDAVVVIWRQLHGRA